MTAIAPTAPTSAPLSRAGLLLPGLGHLLSGARIAGIGMMALTGLAVVAAVRGLPRLDEVLFYGPLRTPSIHGVAAVAGFAALVTVLWRAAWKRAFPDPESALERHSNQAVFLRQFGRNRTGMLGFFGATFLIVATLLTPMITPYDPDKVDVAAKLLTPGWHPLTQDPTPHLLLMGTDQYGRELFTRVLYGGRISLIIGFIAVGLAATIGVTVGAIAGYTGGWLDRGLMWVVDLLLSLPQLVLLLAIVGLFRPAGVQSIFLIVTILGLTSWMSVSRIVRSQVLSLKEQEFVQAARAMGLSPARIVFRHLVPNALAPVIVYGSLLIGGVIIAEASLSYLGLGVAPPTSTWGTLVSDGKDQLFLAPWIATFPGLAIVAAVMSFNLLGDGLRDALDPKLRGR